VTLLRMFGISVNILVLPVSFQTCKCHLRIIRVFIRRHSQVGTEPSGTLMPFVASDTPTMTNNAQMLSIGAKVRYSPGQLHLLPAACTFEFENQLLFSEVMPDK
jgi:hypothetical protein